MPPPDPSWFYSSVAQATAALVGFAGAFMLLRLQENTTRWRTAADQLFELQREWIGADVIVSQQEGEYWKRVEKMGAERTHPREFVDPVLERQRDDAWRRLRPLLDRRDQDQFPRELSYLLLVLGLLFMVGCVVPLMLLGAPSTTAQTSVLTPIVVLLLVTGVLMIMLAKRSFTSWKTATVFPRTAGEHEQQLLNEEGYEQRAAEEKARRAATPAKVTDTKRNDDEPPAA